MYILKVQNPEPDGALSKREENIILSCIKAYYVGFICHPNKTKKDIF